MKRRSNQQRRRKSTEAVLVAALDQFVTKGYQATSTVDIAERAGLTKGSLYFYFKDKQALLLKLLERSENELFSTIFRELRDSGISAHDQLVRYLNWLAKMGMAKEQYLMLPVLISLEFHGIASPVKDYVQSMYERLHGELERIIRQGQKEGEFNDSLSPRSLAVTLVAIADGLLLQWHRWGEQLDGQQLARTARNLVLGGILKK